jgi:hypothetical protein
MSEYDRQRDIDAEGQRAAFRSPTHYDSPFLVENDDGHFLRWHPTPIEIIAKQVRDAISADREGKFRQALISLGWTPPPDKS